MFSDITELEQEIAQFKDNLQNSGAICDNLQKAPFCHQPIRSFAQPEAAPVLLGTGIQLCPDLPHFLPDIVPVIADQHADHIPVRIIFRKETHTGIAPLEVSKIAARYRLDHHGQQHIAGIVVLKPLSSDTSWACEEAAKEDLRFA